MTTHEHLSIEILADYAEGLLGDADATSVAEHLASCADCQAEADLLVSVGLILAADDPGPMPAHYADRIDAALADLAAAEPVTPKRRETTTVGAGAGEGATVIDLASRRRFTPAARVTSVAASLVLLIGGVALGMQALDSTDAGDPGDGLFAVPEETPTTGSARYLAYALSAQEMPTGSDRKKGKDGSVIDKRDGKVFLKSGKVLFPDGVIVVPKKDGAAEVRTYNERTGKSTPLATFRRQETQPRATPAPEVVTAPAVTPKPTPEPTPTPAPKVTAAPTVSKTDPYVRNSGEAYSTDNFAVKIQALLRASGDVQPPVFSESSTDTSSTPAGQNRVSAGALRSDTAAIPGRGPAPGDVVTKVKRCAEQLGLTGLLAGDAGTWKNQAATIVVIRNPENAKQAVGYVVYGDCTKEAPATKASVQWEQRVDLPEAQPEPTPAPTSPPNPGSTVPGTVVPGTVSNSPSSSLEQ